MFMYANALEDIKNMQAMKSMTFLDDNYAFVMKLLHSMTTKEIKSAERTSFLLLRHSPNCVIQILAPTE